MIACGVGSAAGAPLVYTMMRQGAFGSQLFTWENKHTHGVKRMKVNIIRLENETFVSVREKGQEIARTPVEWVNEEWQLMDALHGLDDKQADRALAYLAKQPQRTTIKL